MPVAASRKAERQPFLAFQLQIPAPDRIRFEFAAIEGYISIIGVADGDPGRDLNSGRNPCCTSSRSFRQRPSGRFSPLPRWRLPPEHIFCCDSEARRLAPAHFPA
jgi:hypothetical protein